MNQILHEEAFSHVFEQFAGKKVRYFRSMGNAGDGLIHEGTMQLFRYYNIQQVGEGAEIGMFSGGGSMGNLYAYPKRQRAEALAWCRERGIPFVILPQTWNDIDDIDASKVFCRDHVSLKYRPDAVLAPDCALAFSCPDVDTTLKGKVGYFFRRDTEATVVPACNIEDPCRLTCDPFEYVHLAAQYEVVHTNRLHFAIGAMMAGRKAVLYDNSYPKNRAIYELWLRGRGCEWGDKTPE